MAKQEQEPQQLKDDLEAIAITVHSSNGSGSSDVREVPLKSFLEPEFELPMPDAKLRWLHLPANNMNWIEACAKKWYPRFSGLDERAWALKLRPALPHIINKPLHSRHMEPSCFMSEDLGTFGYLGGPMQMLAEINALRERAGKIAIGTEPKQTQQPLLTLYLPYMNWDTFGGFTSLRKGYNRSNRPGGQHKPPETATEREILESYLAAKLPGSTAVHPRRTLDQFFYSSLNSTESRDNDQTISKWTGAGLDQVEEGWPNAVDDSLLVMVDQLWCWILDKDTVLSSFPSGGFQFQKHGFTDLYNNVREGWSGCKTVWELYSLMAKEATTHLFRLNNRKFADLMEIYSWVIGKKAASLTIYFHQFNQSVAQKTLQSSSIGMELKLVLEIADIIDELKMIRHLLEKQKEVLKSLMIALRKLHSGEWGTQDGTTNIGISENMISENGVLINWIQIDRATDESETLRMLAKGVKGEAGKIVLSADQLLSALLEEVDSMSNNADYAHKMLLGLLDLKQTTAALEEAHSTTQQGRVIMLFTVITIIFLPLSFFTSYFGQNISEITGDPTNPTAWGLWKYGAPISIVVIVSSLIVAFCIMNLKGFLSFWRRSQGAVAHNSRTETV